MATCHFSFTYHRFFENKKGARNNTKKVISACKKPEGGFACFTNVDSQRNLITLKNPLIPIKKPDMPCLLAGRNARKF